MATFIVLKLLQTTPILGWVAKPPNTSKSTLDYPNNICQRTFNKILSVLKVKVWEDAMRQPV